MSYSLSALCLKLVNLKGKNVMSMHRSEQIKRVCTLSASELGISKSFFSQSVVYRKSFSCCPNNDRVCAGCEWIQQNGSKKKLWEKSAAQKAIPFFLFCWHLLALMKMGHWTELKGRKGWISIKASTVLDTRSCPAKAWSCPFPC